MALTIRDPQVERLVQKLAQLTSEGVNEVIRRALTERLANLERHHGAILPRKERLRNFLATEVWPLIGERPAGKQRHQKQGPPSAELNGSAS